MAASGDTAQFGDANRGFQAGHIHGPVSVTHLTPERGYEEAIACLRAWRLTDPGVDRDRILATKDPLLDGSCDWVLQDAAFQKWWATNDTSILWIHGDPGKGKTMIMMALINEISRRVETSSNTEALSFFFCQNTIPELSNATAIIRGLTYLLAKEKPSLRLHAVQQYETAGEKLFEGFNVLQSMWQTLMNMAQDPSVSRLYLLVDALDECDAESLSPLWDLLNQATSTPTKIRWILSSRNEVAIEQRLPGGRFSHNTSLEVNSAHVAQAVHSFIEFKVDRLSEKKNYDVELRRKVKRYFTANCENTFLWVALVHKELDKTPAYDTQRVMEHFPASLERVYQRMLQQMRDSGSQEETPLREAILGAAVAAVRPLDHQEIGFVAGIDVHLASNPYKMNELIKSCGSFLVIREQKVYFVHQSAKDFVLGDSLSPTGLVGLRQAHEKIAGRLLSIIASSLRKDICNLRDPGASVGGVERNVVDQAISPHVQYACCHWADHMVSSKMPMADNPSVQRFFERSLLVWLEALSLLGKMSDSLRSIHVILDFLELERKEGHRLDDGKKGYKRLKKLLRNMKDRCRQANRRTESSVQSLRPLHAEANIFDLGVVVRDVQKFIGQSRLGITQAPLQTYSSALVFAPLRSWVRWQYEKETPTWMKLLPRVENEWSACLQTLEGHSSWVRAVTFSPDGKTVASGSDDKTVKLWDAATGSLRSTLEGHSGSVYAVTFSPDGKTVASGSHDDTVKLWDAATGSLRSTLEGHSSWVRAVTFSPDGKTVASGSEDKTVTLWDAATGSLRSTLEGHSGWVYAVTFSPDGKTVASGSNDKTVKLWDAATGSLRSTLEGHSDWVQAVAFSPDGKTVASGSHDDTVKLWDAATGSLRGTLEGHTSSVYAVAFSPDGKTVASGSHDKTVKLWDAATGLLLDTVSTIGIVNSLRFADDGSVLHTNLGEVQSRVPTRGTLSVHSQPSNNVFIRGDWLFAPQGNRLLWLPPEYRTPISAVFESRVVLGRSPGVVTFIEIDVAALLDASQ